jgi:import receptor subunit TOM22
MVKVEIVESNSPYGSEASSRTSSSASLSSVSSELEADESLFDRLTALVDIVPPTTRHAISERVGKTASFLKRGGKLAGNLVWILTTSALLVALPLALVLEDEAKIVAQEREFLEQQQGQQQASLGRLVMALGRSSTGLANSFHRCWRHPYIHRQTQTSNQKAWCPPVSENRTLCTHALHFIHPKLNPRLIARTVFPQMRSTAREHHPCETKEAIIISTAANTHGTIRLLCRCLSGQSAHSSTQIRQQDNLQRRAV